MSDENCIQCRRPTGEAGREMLRGMNEHHAQLYEWCLKAMPKAMDGAVLDIGCGGGMMLRRMYGRYPFAMFFGADISEEALGLTSEVDADMIGEGSLELHRCSVEDMPFVDGSMDLVTAVETYFFWPDLEASLAEINRVMSPGGILVIGSEMQSEDPDFLRESLEKYGARVRSNDELAALMDGAGFDVRVKAMEGTHNVAFVGSKRF